MVRRLSEKNKMPHQSENPNFRGKKASSFGRARARKARGIDDFIGVPIIPTGPGLQKGKKLRRLI